MFNTERLDIRTFNYTVQAVIGKTVIPMVIIAQPENTEQVLGELRREANVDETFNGPFQMLVREENRTPLYVEFSETEIKIGLDCTYCGFNMLSACGKVRLHGYERRQVYPIVEVENFRANGLRSALLEMAKQCEPNPKVREQMRDDNKVVFELESPDGRVLGLKFHDGNLYIGTEVFDGPFSERRMAELWPQFAKQNDTADVKSRLRQMLCEGLYGRRGSFCDNGCDGCDHNGGCFVCDEIATEMMANGVSIQTA